MADIKNLEHPTLKVPYEILNKKFRASQKVLDREVLSVNSALGDLEKLMNQVQSGGEEEAVITQEGGEGGGKKDVAGLINSLTEMENRLMTLESKSDQVISEEIQSAAICATRISHLKEGCKSIGGNSNQTGGNSGANAPANNGNNPGGGGGGGIDSISTMQWKKIRLDRMLVEYFLRSGYYQSAIHLAKIGNLEALTNIDLFLVAKEVEEALAQRDVAKCLHWCHDNKSKLRKMKSTLEFNVRLQEFIEYIKKDRKIDAVRHAKKYLATDDPDMLPIVQKGMAILAFPLDTQIEPYRDMLQEYRWNALIEQFRHENFRLYQLSSQSVFTVALQVGLSALKTPHCNRVEAKNSECPVCHPALNTLSQNLPNAHCSQSRLICYITGLPLNENNHPLMLPNGYVYGEQALIKMASENDGQIICPRTKEIFSFSDCEKVYVM